MKRGPRCPRPAPSLLSSILCKVCIGSAGPRQNLRCALGHKEKEGHKERKKQANSLLAFEVVGGEEALTLSDVHFVFVCRQ